MKNNLTKYELETTISYNQDEKNAICYTCDRAMISRLDKLCEVSSKITVLKTDDYSKTYIFPKKWVKIKKPRELSDEKRKELAKRARLNFGKLEDGHEKHNT